MRLHGRAAVGRGAGYCPMFLRRYVAGLDCLSHPYDKLYDAGIYNCAGCELPLFSSTTKYDSRTGWPSFWQPLEHGVGTTEDRTLWLMVRTEVHCRRCGGHLGHVFDDGPKPTGLRYCMNGAAMKFVAAQIDATPVTRASRTRPEARDCLMRSLRNVLSFAAVAMAVAFLGAAAAVAQGTPQPDASKMTETGQYAVATFAGGCFWCMEPPYDALDGVISTVSGFMGGTTTNPTYYQVTAGGTGHIEVVQVTYDPKKVSYAKLLEVFWRNVDPYDGGGQFCDRGDSYTTAIFTHTAEQKKLAEESKAELMSSGPLKETIATVVRDAGPFTAAEDYHQDYYIKNPLRYKYYRYRCGRDARLETIWGKPTN